MQPIQIPEFGYLTFRHHVRTPQISLNLAIKDVISILDPPGLTPSILPYRLRLRVKQW